MKKEGNFCKKKTLLILLIAIIFFPVISAPEIKFSRDSYQPRETLQAEITGNFISLKPENILIYENNKFHSEPVIKDLARFNDSYYFYALLPNKESNFSLKIQKTTYILLGELKSDEIIKNFTILKTNESSLSINPGFFLADSEFSVKIKALDKGQDITAKLEESSETKTFYLTEETEKTITFSISNLTSRKNNLKINNYNIPVFLKIKLRNESKKLSSIPGYIAGTILYDQDYFFRIFIENYGDEKIENIEIFNNFDAEIIPSKIGVLEKGNSTEINVKIIKPVKNISGEIYAKMNNETILTIPVSFLLTENRSKISIDNSGVVPQKQSLSCKNLGQICLESQVCDGEIVSSLEGICCKGTCTEKQAYPSDYRWIAGIILLIILIIIIYFAIRRIRKKQRLETPKQMMNLRTQRYTKRMIPSREVRGKIEQI